MKEITYIAAVIIQSKRENHNEHLRHEYELEDIHQMDKWIKQVEEENAVVEDEPEILGENYGSRGGGGHDEERQGR